MLFNNAAATASSSTVGVVPLLSWLSLVLPVVGCGIPPDVYRRMLDDMSSSRASMRRADREDR